MRNQYISKAEYQSPQAEIFEMRVERGFEMSGSQEPEANHGTEGLANSSREYVFN